MKPRTTRIAASAYINTNTATAFEVQKRKVGYHGTISKDRNCRTCAYSKFKMSPSGSIVGSSRNCSQCTFPIGEYGVCRQWKAKASAGGLGFLSDLGLDDIMKGGV